MAGPGVIPVAFVIGLPGGRLTAGTGWMAACLDPAMIAGGMGLVDAPHGAAGKPLAGSFTRYHGLA